MWRDDSSLNHIVSTLNSLTFIDELMSLKMLAVELVSAMRDRVACASVTMLLGLEIMRVCLGIFGKVVRIQACADILPLFCSIRRQCSAAAIFCAIPGYAVLTFIVIGRSDSRRPAGSSRIYATSRLDELALRFVPVLTSCARYTSLTGITLDTQLVAAAARLGGSTTHRWTWTGARLRRLCAVSLCFCL